MEPAKRPDYQGTVQTRTKDNDKFVYTPLLQSDGKKVVAVAWEQTNGTPNSPAIKVQFTLPDSTVIVVSLWESKTQ